MNARQRRRERRIDARIDAGIGRDIEAHMACRRSLMEIDRAAVTAAIEDLFRRATPAELDAFLPVVTYR